MTIVPADVSDQRIIDLLQTHVRVARAQSPPCCAHALDLDEVQAPNVRLYAAWEGERLLGVGALMHRTPESGELKSMHTAQMVRGRGVGGAMLRYIIAVARERGYTHLSLETGASAYFEPARALYRRHGFRECEPFADYRPDPNSVFMRLELR